MYLSSYSPLCSAVPSQEWAAWGYSIQWYSMNGLLAQLLFRQKRRSIERLGLGPTCNSILPHFSNASSHFCHV